MKLCECGCGLPTRIATRTRGSIGHVKGQPIRFRLGHANRGPGGFAPYTITDCGYETPCWIWAKATAGRLPYGNQYHLGRSMGAHRFMYERMVGAIPEGMQLDHLCRTPNCVNPAHLESVTARVNILRGTGPSAINAAKTHCSKGHEFTPENTARTGEGHRVCITCRRAASLRWYYKQKAAA